MLKRNYLLPVLLCLFFCLFLSGCGSSPEKPPVSSDSANEPPVISPPQVLVPSADGKKTLGNTSFLLDISNVEYGYMIAQADDTNSRYNLQFTDPNGITYSYFVESGTSAVIPFTGGNGTYTINAYEQIADKQYSALYFETLDLELINIFYPFLYPNQYVNFSKESAAAELSLSLLPEDATDLESLDAIYLYVTSHITYDEEKARTIEAGYLPDVDEILHKGTGICFDYAALMTAMLRTRGIPCKLQIGYSNEIKHAWIDVFIRSIGWINHAISFDGKNWHRMDPTFEATSDNSQMIREYIGDGNNYTVQFSR